MSINSINTIGGLREFGYSVKHVKDEMRDNLIRALKKGESLFPGIVGYEESVIPQVINAILSKHDFIFLGLRGQAKSRILRELTRFLDEWMPIIKGSEINDNPFAPVSKFARDLCYDAGDETPVEWIHRDSRYAEKLATPDVKIADLIGDIDPIKAASQRLHYAHEGAIHYGIIPRTNRGIFGINELPDLQQRIQVGLLNIMQEKDIQIRGFPVRIPLDMLMVYTANPEDYTNRGNIITPLRDRISSQIHTHYPETIAHGISITEQEAWVSRNNGVSISIPQYFKEIVEFSAVKARQSEYIDQKSGVSARMPITCMENLVSNVEKRNIILSESYQFPRLSDFEAVLPSIVGKIELVYEGEQEGVINVARNLIGQAVKEVFTQYFPEVYVRSSEETESNRAFDVIKSYFNSGKTIELGDMLSTDDYYARLDAIDGLHSTAMKFVKVENTNNKAEVGAAMEFLLEGLHQHSILSKEIVNGVRTYSDYIDNVFSQFQNDFDSDI